MHVYKGFLILGWLFGSLLLLEVGFGLPEIMISSVDLDGKGYQILMGMIMRY